MCIIEKIIIVNKKIYMGKIFEGSCIEAVKAISEEGHRPKTVRCIVLVFLIKKTIPQKIFFLVKNNNNSNLNIDISHEIDLLVRKRHSLFFWKMLSIYFIYNGFYYQGYICRNIAKNILIGKTKSSYEKALALIENGMMSDARNVINKLEKGCNRIFVKDELKYLHELLDLIEGKKIYRNNNFSSYISKKSVLIIGPTRPMNDVDIPFKEEIHCIIRNNVMIKNIKSSIPINIAYYNGAATNLLLKNNDVKKYVQNLDWIVIKKADINLKADDVNIHRAPDVTNLMFMGNANMLPIMVFDLLIHGAEKVFICGNNLYLTKQVHAKDYVSQPSNKEMMYSLTVHNLLSQHSFLKLMYINGLIIPDDELKEVLELSTSEYAKKMEKYY